MLRADGADLLLLEADPKTAAGPPRAAVRRRELRGVHPRRPTSSPSTISEAIGRRVPGEFELLLDDPRRDRDRTTTQRALERARRGVPTGAARCRDRRSSARPASTPARTRCSPTSTGRRPRCASASCRADAGAVQPARAEPARATHGARRDRRAPDRPRRPAGDRRGADPRRPDPLSPRPRGLRRRARRAPRPRVSRRRPPSSPAPSTPSQPAPP